MKEKNRDIILFGYFLLKNISLIAIIITMIVKFFSSEKMTVNDSIMFIAISIYILFNSIIKITPIEMKIKKATEQSAKK
jgi:hypothetical protein